jgi:hypothetical protein
VWQGCGEGCSLRGFKEIGRIEQRHILDLSRCCPCRQRTPYMLLELHGYALISLVSPHIPLPSLNFLAFTLLVSLDRPAIRVSVFELCHLQR